jgi:hypothetical protein
MYDVASVQAVESGWKGSAVAEVAGYGNGGMDRHDGEGGEVVSSTRDTIIDPVMHNFYRWACSTT